MHMKSKKRQKTIHGDRNQEVVVYRVRTDGKGHKKHYAVIETFYILFGEVATQTDTIAKIHRNIHL